MSPETDYEDSVGSYARYARIGYCAIAVVFGGFGLWAYSAPLDSAAVAQGKVAVETDRKPVQHLEGGIVREILIKEAQQVNEGDVLFRLQPTQATANADLLRKQLDGALALEARLIAERDGASRIAFPDSVVQRRQVRETATAMADQERQLLERRRSIDNQINALKSKIDQTRKDIYGREQRLSSTAAQRDSYATEIRAVSQLAEKGYYPRNKLLGLERERTRLDGEAAAARGEIDRLKETIEESRIQIRQIEQRQIEEVTQQLADARQRISDTREKLAIAEDVLTRIEVRAPRTGSVQGLKVQTVGAVVAPGATLAEIVPVGETLVMAARVSPLDITNVAVGQKAEVRFPAFSAKETPAIFGKVETLSADAMTDEATKEAYYLARVTIEPGSIAPDLARKIVPGMPADVLITTGERTMLQYLMSPLRTAMAKAMREK